MHRNEDVTRRLWTAVADGDSEALEEVLATGVIWRSIGNNPLSGEYFGPSAVIGYLSTVGKLADDFTSTLEEIYTSPWGSRSLRCRRFCRCSDPSRNDGNFVLRPH